MIRAVKIRLLPTPEQEILFWKSAGVARWSYNYFLSENEKLYQEYLKNDKTGNKSISEGKIRKHINNVLKKTTHKWLSEVSSNVMKQAVKDANIALQRFFKESSGYPRFKSRHKSKISFYVNYESLKRLANGFQGERLGYIKTAYPLPKIKGHYSNPHISFDGKHWYLSVGFEVKTKEVELTGKSIGIDLGVKDLAVVSNGKVYGNINKTRRIKQLKKRLKREQRKVSRKIEGNIKSRDSKRRPTFKRPLRECRNIQRQNQKIRLIYKKLTDIINNYLHQTTTEIVKAKPSRIVMENLNVSGMMKNRHLSKAIAEQKFYEFKRQIKYKCEMYGIEFVEVDRFYPSSKTCSHCGHVKVDLKLSDRIYKCAECGLTIDRDLNAAINLANYSI
ncbi:MAG: transposase [Selenomonadaceae bacterium]|nr:transposase [Selenomonadaceae bacterium]